MSDEHDHRDSELSHIYREGGWPEPRRQIDQAILAASRSAARRERSFARRWAPPFALAATVVLSFTVFMKVSEETPDTLLDPSTFQRRPAAPAEAPRSAERPEPAAAAKAAPAPKPRPAQQAAKPAESLAARKSAPAPKPAAAPAPTAPQPFVPAPKLAPVESATNATRPAPQPAPAVSVLKKEAPAAMRADRLEPRPEARSEGLRALEPATVREAARSAPAQAPSSPPATVGPLAQPPTPAAAGAASTASGASDAAAGIVIRRSTPERTPQTWIEDIRRLKGEGRTEEAGRELAEFRKRHPGYTLPEDLRP